MKAHMQSIYMLPSHVHHCRSTHTHIHTHQHHHTVQVAKRTHVFVNGIYHFPAAIASVVITLLSLVGLVVTVVVVLRRETEGGS